MKKINLFACIEKSSKIKHDQDMELGQDLHLTERPDPECGLKRYF
jgi:hypothetical protein